MPDRYAVALQPASESGLTRDVYLVVDLEEEKFFQCSYEPTAAHRYAKQMNRGNTVYDPSYFRWTPMPRA